MAATNNLYLERQDLVVAGWLCQNAPLDGKHEDMLITSGELGSLVVTECDGNTRFLGPFSTRQVEDFERRVYFVSKPTYEFELFMADGARAKLLRNVTSTIEATGNLVIDMGTERIYVAMVTILNM